MLHPSKPPSSPIPSPTSPTSEYKSYLSVHYHPSHISPPRPHQPQSDVAPSADSELDAALEGVQFPHPSSSFPKGSNGISSSSYASMASRFDGESDRLKGRSGAVVDFGSRTTKRGPTESSSSLPVSLRSKPPTTVGAQQQQQTQRQQQHLRRIGVPPALEEEPKAPLPPPTTHTTPKSKSPITLSPVTESTLQDFRRLNTVIFPIKYNDEFYKSALRNADMTRLSWVGGECVGAVCCLKEVVRDFAPERRWRVYIRTIGVLAPYRRLGIGQLLIKTMVAACQSDPSIDYMFLHVQTSNTSALRFYESLGFKVVEKIEGYYRLNKGVEPPDAFLVQLDLRNDRKEGVKQQQKQVGKSVQVKKSRESMMDLDEPPINHTETADDDDDNVEQMVWKALGGSEQSFEEFGRRGKAASLQTGSESTVAPVTPERSSLTALNPPVLSKLATPPRASTKPSTTKHKPTDELASGNGEKRKFGSWAEVSGPLGRAFAKQLTKGRGV
ncbi:N-alpha-acetyltransferase 50 [Chytridiales sp. JEL 0842]|nr:N-alpha-acetyltransferase 50 [Chytridiales sp. JEL 0842]